MKRLKNIFAALLLNRPDVRMADHVMEEAFYNTQAARSAFYPSISPLYTLLWAEGQSEKMSFFCIKGR